MVCSAGHGASEGGDGDDGEGELWGIGQVIGQVKAATATAAKANYGALGMSLGQSRRRRRRRRRRIMGYWASH